MRGYFTLVSTILYWLMMPDFAHAQKMQGQIMDVGDGAPLADVSIQNIHTETGILSDAHGKFMLDAGRGHLIEFRKEGYRMLRVRLPNGTFPSYFKVVLEKIPERSIDPNAAPADYAADSAKYYALYERELAFPKFTTIDAIKHPFSAMSKRNQEIWQFQREFEFYQQQKYIDFTFNPKLVHTITGLGGDSLQTYMQMFRPTYGQLRSMSEYTYFQYIKRTVAAYRERGPRARMGPGRGTR